MLLSSRVVFEGCKTNCNPIQCIISSIRLHCQVCCKLVMVCKLLFCWFHIELRSSDSKLAKPLQKHSPNSPQKQAWKPSSQIPWRSPVPWLIWLRICSFSICHWVLWCICSNCTNRLKAHSDAHLHQRPRSLLQLFAVAKPFVVARGFFITNWFKWRNLNKACSSKLPSWIFSLRIPFSVHSEWVSQTTSPSRAPHPKVMAQNQTLTRPFGGMHRFHKPYCPKRIRPRCLPSTFLSQTFQWGAPSLSFTKYVVCPIDMSHQISQKAGIPTQSWHCNGVPVPTSWHRSLLSWCKRLFPCLLPGVLPLKCFSSDSL